MTPMFPGWHLPTLRRKPQTPAQKIARLKEQAKKKTLSQLGLCLALCLPPHLFNGTSKKAFQGVDVTVLMRDILLLAHRKKPRHIVPWLMWMRYCKRLIWFL